MIVRAAIMLISACLCFGHGEAEGRSKSRPKRAAAIDSSRLAVSVDEQERLRSWRAAQWSLGDAPRFDDGSDARGIKWRLRGAGVKVRVPIALLN